MPHIRMRSIPESTVVSLSRELPKALAEVMQTPEDNFSIELVATKFFKNGESIAGDPLIEVLWFDRGQVIQNLSAKKITELVRKHFSAEYISVVFTDLPKQHYYENGEHF